MKIDKTDLACVIAAVKNATHTLLPKDLHDWACSLIEVMPDGDETAVEQITPRLHNLLRDLIKLAESDVDVRREVWVGRGTDDAEVLSMAWDEQAEAAVASLQPGQDLLECIIFDRVIASRAQLQGSDPT